MKRLPSMALVVALGATVAGCDSDPGEKVVQRDVYSGPNALENCIADWGNEALCAKQLDAAQAKQVAAAGQGGGSGGAPSIIFWGPGYMGSDRATLHNGQTVTPSATRATQTAAFAPQPGGGYKPVSFTAPKPAGVSSGFTQRGGFSAPRGVSSGS